MKAPRGRLTCDEEATAKQDGACSARWREEGGQDVADREAIGSSVAIRAVLDGLKSSDRMSRQMTTPITNLKMISPDSITTPSLLDQSWPLADCGGWPISPETGKVASIH